MIKRSKLAFFRRSKLSYFRRSKLSFFKIDQEVVIIANYQEIEKALGALRGLG
jgi:hypothetical protein